MWRHSLCVFHWLVSIIHTHHRPVKSFLPLQRIIVTFSQSCSYLYPFWRGVMRIHPSFRLIALAEPPDLTTASGQWLNAEMLSNFLFHHMTPLPSADEVKVIDSLANHHVSETLFDLSDHLRRSRDPTVSSAHYHYCICMSSFCVSFLVVVFRKKLSSCCGV